MKLTVTKTETQEVEIQFPVFKKHAYSYYKGISENEWVQVTPMISHISINAPYEMAKIITKGEDITEDEFNEAFIEAFNKIKSYKPQYSTL